MTSRRNFIKSLAVGVAGANLSAVSASSPFVHGVELPDKIGIITNTVGEEIKADCKATLRELAEIGYTFVEGSVPNGLTVMEYRALLKEFGMTCVATGSGMGNLQKNLDTYRFTAESLGAPYVVCYYPWLSSATDLTMEEVLETSETINKIGKQLKESGFRFAWHNHAKEFVDVEGGLAFDVLMEHTDPEFSTVELDWYWVVKGGYDPAAYLKRYPGRFELAHIKDMNNNRDGGISCVGQGIIDFAPIFDASKAGGVKHFIVENERAVKGIECARVSFGTIRGYLDK